MANDRLPSNEDPIGNLSSTLPSIGHKSSASIDEGRHDAAVHAEFLMVLKRRSLPHLPKRSSSLTLPPATPPADIPPSTPAEALPSPEEWQIWLREFLDGGRSTPPPVMDEDISPNDWEGFRSQHGSIDANSSEIENENSVPDADQTDPLPVKGSLSARYHTVVANVWNLRPRLTWSATTEPLAHAFRFTHGIFQANEAPQNVGYRVLERGCQTSEQARVPRVESEISHEDGNLLLNLNKSFSLPVIEGIDPGAVGLESERSNVGVPPSSPRPAFREIPSTISNTHQHSHPPPRPAIRRPSAVTDIMLENPPPPSRPRFPYIASATNMVMGSFQRLNESIPLLEAQQLLDAALLLNFRMRRTLRDLASAALAASLLVRGESDGQEDTSVTDVGAEIAGTIGEGNLTIDDAVSGPLQGNTVASVQHRALERVQSQSDSLDGPMKSVAGNSGGASSSGVELAGTFRIDSEDATDWGDEGFAPLQRVQSRRPYR